MKYRNLKKPMRKTNICLMPKKILLLVLSCTLSLFNWHAQNNRHDTETDPKDKGLAEYYEGQMNRPKSW